MGTKKIDFFFSRKFEIEFDLYFDLCWRAEIIQVGLNMHLYVDIGDASSSLWGSTSSFFSRMALLFSLSADFTAGHCTGNFLIYLSFSALRHAMFLIYDEPLWMLFLSLHLLFRALGLRVCDFQHGWIRTLVLRFTLALHVLYIKYGPYNFFKHKSSRVALYWAGLRALFFLLLTCMHATPFFAYVAPGHFITPNFLQTIVFAQFGAFVCLLFHLLIGISFLFVLMINPWLHEFFFRRFYSLR